MPSIVQFIHPGGEHGPDEKGSTLKSWNYKEHKRKFLKSKGLYVNNGILSHEEEDLVFWGEWEPPSFVIKLNYSGNKLNPKWLHTRNVPEHIPECGGLQNTDPYIFNGPFRYFLCHQIRTSTMRPTKLAKPMLEKGSLILFGSNCKENGKNFFQIDTVIVVEKGDKYIAGNDNRNLFLINEKDKYYDISYLRAFPNKLCYSLELCLYRGVIYGDKEKSNGIYSFVPSKIYNVTGNGFPRVKIKSDYFIAEFQEYKNDMEQIFGENENFFTDKLPQMFKITKDVNIKIIKEVWEKIVDISRSKPYECVEGVEFH